MTKPGSQPSSPTEEFQRAIEKLETFTEKHAFSAIPSVTHYEEEWDSNSSLLQKSIFHVRRFLTTTFSEKTREEAAKKKAEDREELLQAIKVVKKNYLFLEKLFKGNPDQQSLAASAMEAIQRFNALIAKNKNPPPTWSLRLARFLYGEKNHVVNEESAIQPIQLPKISVAVYEEHQNSKKQRSIFKIPQSSKKTAWLIEQREKITKEVATSEIPAMSNAKEAFRMKAITLLQNHGIKFSSRKDGFKSVRVTPIQASTKDSTTYLEQVISPFPGETIVIRGAFGFNQATPGKSIPIPKSFKISYSGSIQTGYPHPSQCAAGWALTEDILLLYPQGYPHQLPLCYAFNARKQEIAQALLPNERLNIKAKELLRLKKENFLENQAEFLALHYQLAQSLLKASGVAVDEPQKCFEKYFIANKYDDSLYDYLSTVQEAINHHFITRPRKKLETEWVESRNIDLTSQDSEKRFSAAARILEEEVKSVLFELEQEYVTANEKEQIMLSYMREMGLILGKASHFSLLQELSEIIGFFPPRPNEFEKKIQVLAYKQQCQFFEELDEFDLNQNPTKNRYTIHEHQKRQLETEIQLLKATSLKEISHPAVDLVEERLAYFDNLIPTYS